MAKNLHVIVNGTTIQKRNLKNVHYPNTSTNIKIVNRKIGSRGNREYWRKESILYNNGATEESGTWNQQVIMYDRGRTFTFDSVGMVESGGGNNNSNFGTLLYSSKKISVSAGDTISVSFTCSDTNDTIYFSIVDTNLSYTASWFTKCNVVFLDSVPDGFHDTWDVFSWVVERANKELWYFGGKGNETSTKRMAGTSSGNYKTYSATISVTGDYYVALVISGYDCSYNKMVINNFRIE